MYMYPRGITWSLFTSLKHLKFLLHFCRVFVESVHFLERNVTYEGIFRKTGSVTRQKAIRVSQSEKGEREAGERERERRRRREGERGCNSFLLSSTQAALSSGSLLDTSNVHDVANLLKQYLRELPSSLLRGEEFTSVFEDSHGKEQNILLACLLLPQTHLQVCTCIVLNPLPPSG